MIVDRVRKGNRPADSVAGVAAVGDDWQPRDCWPVETVLGFLKDVDYSCSRYKSYSSCTDGQEAFAWMGMLGLRALRYAPSSVAQINSEEVE